MEEGLLLKPSKDATHTGVLAQLELTDNSDTTKNYMRNLKRRAKYHNYSLMKQVLVDYIKENFWGLLRRNRKDVVSVLSISFDECGNSVMYRTFDDIPNEDVPCPCGNPKHWFIQYKDLREE